MCAYIFLLICFHLDFESILPFAHPKLITTFAGNRILPSASVPWKLIQDVLQHELKIIMFLITYIVQNIILNIVE